MNNLFILSMLLLSCSKINLNEKYKPGPEREEEEKCFTPLHLNAKNGRAKIAKALLDLGANANGQYKGITPLHLAAYYGHKEVVQVLLDQQNIDINNAFLSYPIKNFHEPINGITPLQVAIIKGHHEIIALLESRGAINLGGTEGEIKFFNDTVDHIEQQEKSRDEEKAQFMKLSGF